jgi:hypothetical protein
MKTYEKGAIGEHRVVADLINKGYRVHKPLIDSLPYDIVVSIKGFFYRVQVKYVRMRKGNIETSPRRANTHKVKSRNEEFDLLAIFCPDTDKCYYVWTSEFDTSIRLRTKPTKNNQAQGVRMAEDYLNIII